MRQQSRRSTYPQYRQDSGNEHLGYNEARYSGRVYNQDYNHNKQEWHDEQPDARKYNDNDQPAYYLQDQYTTDRQQRNNLDEDNHRIYDDNQRDNRNNYALRAGNPNLGNNYRERQDDINADRSITGSRNYMREEHAYGQSNDSMYKAQRGKRQSRQNYQDDYNNYNNNAQYPYRGDLKAYDTNFENPENFRKEKRRGFGSRYKK